MRVLVVEDESKIARAIKKGLEQETFAVDVCHDGDEGLRFALDEPYNIIILDRMLPGKDGVSVCRELQAAGEQTPVLLLTAKDKVADRVDGLNAGADDYLVKLFAFEELLARVRTLLRRPSQLVSPVLTCDSLSLNTQTYEVARAQANPADAARIRVDLLHNLSRTQKNHHHSRHPQPLDRRPNRQNLRHCRRQACLNGGY